MFMIVFRGAVQPATKVEGVFSLNDGYSINNSTSAGQCGFELPMFPEVLRTRFLSGATK
jgi:hypothetical protein